MLTHMQKNDIIAAIATNTVLRISASDRDTYIVRSANGQKLVEIENGWAYGLFNIVFTGQKHTIWCGGHINKNPTPEQKMFLDIIDACVKKIAAQAEQERGQQKKTLDSWASTKMRE